MITNINFPPQKGPVPPLIRVLDAARLLDVSRQTVHNLIESGELKASDVNPAYSARRHVRVTGDSLRRFYRRRFGHTLEAALNPLEKK